MSHVGDLQPVARGSGLPPAARDNVSLFSTAWNDLRNAVLGRGTAAPPNVPVLLAERVGSSYERWRTFLAGVGPTATVLQVSVLAPWVLEYRELANQAKAAGLKFTAMPDTLIEDVTRGVDTVVRSGKTALLILAVIAVPLVLAPLFARRS